MSYTRTWRYGPEGQAVLCETQEMFDRFVELGYKDSPDAYKVKVSQVMPEPIVSVATDAPVQAEPTTNFSIAGSDADTIPAQKPKPRRRR
jgi:hypothetical protein